MAPRISKLFWLFGLSLLPACGDDSPAGPSTSAVASVTVSADSLVLVEDDSTRLQAVVRAVSGAVVDTIVTWRSLDPQIVAVSATGVVQAIAPGLGEIVARVGMVEDSVSVRVAVRAEEVEAVSGDGQRAAQGATLPDPLVVRVIDRRGEGVPGQEVRFEVVSGGGTIAPQETETNQGGTASAIWTLGPTPGEQTARALALGDTILFTAHALSSATRVEVEPSSASLDVGETVQLQATAFGPDGGLVDAAIQWESRQPSVAAVDQDGLVSGLAAGGTWIVASTLTGVRDSAQITVTAPPAPVCQPANVTSMAVGQVLQFAGAAAGSLCLGPGEYVAIPFYASQISSGRLALTVEATGVTGVVGPPTPSRSTRGTLSGADPRERDLGWEDRFRERERREIGRLMAGLRGPAGARAQLTPRFDVPAVGELLSLNTQASCTNTDFATGRVVAVSDRAIVVADTTNPAGGFSSAEFQSVAETVDTLIYPVDVAAFGEPTDIDSNSRVIIFYTKAVNQLTDPDSDSFVGGFFFSGDLFPADSCPGSNFAEMFYMLAPDPEGSLGKEFSREFVFRTTLSTVGHELQHLINASRRIYIVGAQSLEEVWLNEALSHIAEELLFYRTTPYGPRQNLAEDEIRASQQTVDAANRFLTSNLGRYRSYLANPDTVSLIAQDALPTRGAGWAFLRYAADREPGVDEVFFMDLVNSTTTGLTNLEQALGAAPLEWMQDWTVAVFADDAVPSTSPVYAQPSWNFRSLLPLVGAGFPLRVTAIAPGTTTFTIRAGGSIFGRFAVPPGGAGDLEWRSADSSPPPELRLSIQRTK